MNYEWERLADAVCRCRLPFLDVTIGLVTCSAGTLLIDTGTTMTEANAIAADIETMGRGGVSHILLTHDHFDHILGSSAFPDAEIYCAPQVAVTMADRRDHLRDDAVRHGADVAEVDRAIEALPVPQHRTNAAVIDLGDIAVTVGHPGRGHTDHDLIAVVPASESAVVFCGDLVEESGDPCVDDDSDLAAWPTTLDRLLEVGGADAAYVPGHGAVVDADFVRRQRDWLAARV
ncbi:MBL fold metallo-hydrolase [Mycolicibacterium pulveris]|uniref:MBL fold metallo-hydrolase n=1 Tax=Mycolicibacterium pulveris TaxID=36813 RepID=A0A7I7URG1_MYCPV|nr:MBL fold metallo-hydrolase [Mycolicibacterium pulveris]MCV6983492.1 MBL fold metallo-hydrolase [Mycolicibacterium pulveris]BBY83371.1 MBL fold metallo-hydrolase [Mycolicibacterium pulveris]